MFRFEFKRQTDLDEGLVDGVAGRGANRGVVGSGKAGENSDDGVLHFDFCGLLDWSG